MYVVCVCVGGGGGEVLTKFETFRRNFAEYIGGGAQVEGYCPWTRGLLPLGPIGDLHTEEEEKSMVPQALVEMSALMARA